MTPVSEDSVPPGPEKPAVGTPASSLPEEGATPSLPLPLPAARAGAFRSRRLLGSHPEEGVAAEAAGASTSADTRPSVAVSRPPSGPRSRCWGCPPVRRGQLPEPTSSAEEELDLVRLAAEALLSSAADPGLALVLLPHGPAPPRFDAAPPRPAPPGQSRPVGPAEDPPPGPRPRRCRCRCCRLRASEHRRLGTWELLGPAGPAPCSTGGRGCPSLLGRWASMLARGLGMRESLKVFRLRLEPKKATERMHTGPHGPMMASRAPVSPWSPA
eukprot:4128473-Pyramimonas_sp.AAC.1